MIYSNSVCSTKTPSNDKSNQNAVVSLLKRIVGMKMTQGEESQ